MAFHWDFFVAFFSIVGIDLILAGDNAVVISMAVRNLPSAQKKKGLIFGAAAAVILRVILTFFAAKLLTYPFVKFIGGLLLVWIALHISVDGDHESKNKEAKTLKEAVGIILVADVIMSLDNILAIAGASGGNFYLVLFGLGLSIPLVVLTSSIFSRLIDKYPLILYMGIAILGRVAGEMIIKDPFINNLLDPHRITQYFFEATVMTAVLVAAILRNWRKKLKQIDSKLECQKVGTC